MPTVEQHLDIHRFAGSRRFCVNKALALQKDQYGKGEQKLGHASLCKLLTEGRDNGKRGG